MDTRKPFQEDVHVRIAEKLGANYATCMMCGVTTHERREGALVQVNEHRKSCTRGPNLQNIPKPHTAKSERFRDILHQAFKPRGFRHTSDDV